MPGAEKEHMARCPGGIRTDANHIRAKGAQGHIPVHWRKGTDGKV